VYGVQTSTTVLKFWRLRDRRINKDASTFFAKAIKCEGKSSTSIVGFELSVGAFVLNSRKRTRVLKHFGVPAHSQAKGAPSELQVLPR